MTRSVKHILVFVAAAATLSLVGCAKYTTEMELVITPRSLVVASSPPDSPAYMITAYSYYIPEDDIENWAPQSYAEAEAGIIRNIVTGEARSHDFAREQDEDTFIRFTLSSSPVLLLAVDPVNRFYAWREFEYPVPMASMTIVLRFQLYRTEARFVDLKWNIVNANLDENEG